METPHIHLLSERGFAKTVLMPGDPKRAKVIAETFLQNAELVNDVRGIQGYTGDYRGHSVSVMASGMGMPSMGIYSFELFSFFGVENIIRVGSAGGIGPGVQLRDIVIGLGANTNSDYGKQFGVRGAIAPTCSFALLQEAVQAADELELPVKIGNLLSSDTFYDADENSLKQWAKVGTLAVEMEAAALYLNAMHLGKRALAVCTVSDLPFTGEGCSADERQNAFTDMMRLALETAVRMEENA